MLYDDKKITLIEYTIYKKWFDEFISEIPISKIIYVKTDPEIAHQRVIIRNRTGEQIPIEYLTSCHNYNENWLEKQDYEMITLNGNINIYENTEELTSWINDIKQFIAPKKKLYDDYIPVYKKLFSQNYDDYVWR